MFVPPIEKMLDKYKRDQASKRGHVLPSRGAPLPFSLLIGCPLFSGSDRLLALGTARAEPDRSPTSARLWNRIAIDD